MKNFDQSTKQLGAKGGGKLGIGKCGICLGPRFVNWVPRDRGG